MHPLKKGFMSAFSKKALPCFVVVALGFTTGCASQKAGITAPELPARHWLDESPGVPVEHKDKLQSAVPKLYDANKSFSFDDCVYLTIQQSPMLVNSAVDIEIQKVDLTSAIWQYLPEPSMRISVSNNLTVNNRNINGTPNNYGEPVYEIAFDAAFPNPMQSYFSHQAQKIMLNLAVSTHRKAIGNAITEIAQLYQRLDAQKEILRIQKELVPLSKKVTAYWRQLESVDGQQGVALNLAQQREHEAALKVERTEIENSMLRTKLKVLAGVEINHKLNINTKDTDKIVSSFNGRALSWEEQWKKTEDELLLRSQVKLGDFNIMVAWAKYIPDVTFSINQSPPAGQYQPVDGTEDTFIHANISFPLIDWGRRYRGVQKARMEKAKAFQEQARARTQYSNIWTEAQQNVHLTETSMKIAKTNLEVAKMQEKEAAINFKEGITPYPDLATKKEALLAARIAFVQAELNYKLAQLTWMDVAGVLKEKYIGPPAAEII